MTARDFAFWLQGLFELGKPTTLDAAQTDLVKRHLAMVFIHEIDPSAGPPEMQAKLNEAHALGLEEIKKELAKQMDEKIQHAAWAGPPVMRC